MYLRIIYFLLVVPFFNLDCIGQSSNKLIPNSYAFSKFSSPGNMMVPEAGQPGPQVIQERIIYLQVKGNLKPEIKGIKALDYYFSHSIRPISDFPESPGINSLTGKPMKMVKRKGYTLWRIDLQPAHDSMNIPAHNLRNYYVRGMLNSTPFNVLIKKEIVLHPDMRY